MSTDPEREPPAGRLWAVPAALFVAVAGLVLLLAVTHPAKPGVPQASTAPVEVGDAASGRAVFAETCASCHGEAGAGGGGAPRLQGAAISLAQARATIDGGKGFMPSGLVEGAAERDVLAYLATILEQP